MGTKKGRSNKSGKQDSDPIADEFDKAKAMMVKGNTAQAIRTYRRLLKRVSLTDVETRYKLHNNLGVAYLATKHWDNAISEFDLSLSTGPQVPTTDMSDILVNKADTMMQKEEFENAIGIYLEALRVSSQNPKARRLIGSAYLLVGEYENAMQTFKGVVATHPDDVVMLLQLAHCHLMTQDFEGAITLYNRVLAIDEANKDAHNNLGIVLSYIERYDEAVVAFDRALSIAPDMKIAHLNKGIVLHNVTDFSAAIECFDKALAIDSNYHAAREAKDRSLQQWGPISLASDPYFMQKCSVYKG
jgi:tetratricopeptide (TPR) repeat protein